MIIVPSPNIVIDVMKKEVNTKAVISTLAKRTSSFTENVTPILHYERNLFLCRLYYSLSC